MAPGPTSFSHPQFHVFVPEEGTTVWKTPGTHTLRDRELRQLPVATVSVQVDGAGEVPPSPRSPLPCTPVPGPRVNRAAAASLEGGGDVLRQIPGSGESPRGSLLTNPNPGSFVFSSWEFRVCPGRMVGKGGQPGLSSQLHLGAVFSSGQPWDFSFSTFKMGLK